MENMKGIRNVLFDLGAVLINIDFEKVALAFKALGVKDFEKRYSHLQADSLFEKLETGKISNEMFYENIAYQSGLPLKASEIRDAWNAILLDFRTESMAYLQQLSKRYRLFLLSNTNAIHLESIHKILYNQLGVEKLDQYFEKAYYSHLVGMRKPGKAVFDYVLADAGISAEETFFIDDASPNIETAAAMGFKTHLLLPGERIEKLNWNG